MRWPNTIRSDSWLNGISAHKKVKKYTAKNHHNFTAKIIRKSRISKELFSQKSDYWFGFVGLLCLLETFFVLYFTLIISRDLEELGETVAETVGETKLVNIRNNTRPSHTRGGVRLLAWCQVGL